MEKQYFHRLPSRLFKALPTALALLSLWGCWGENAKVAGGDDIPNDVEPLGKKSAQARDDSSDWNGFKSTPRTSPGMYDTTHVPDSIPDTSHAGSPKRAAGSGAGSSSGSAGALAKRASDLSGAVPGGSADGLLPTDSLKPIDTLITKVVDTAKGTVAAVHTQVKDSVRKVDSTVFTPADSGKPGSGGVMQVTQRVTSADTGVWQVLTFRDADGDGFLAPRAGSLNRADIDLSVKSADGVVTRTSLEIAAGKDLDFNARGDNQVLASMVTRLLGPDTLDSYTLLDADGDSIVLDLSKDTNVVDLVEKHAFATSSPELSATAVTRLVVFSKDSTRNYAVRYRGTVRLRSGDSVVVDAFGSAADSSFRAGGQGAWKEIRYFAADSLLSHARTATVRMGAKPGDFKGDVLLDIAVQDRFRSAAYSGFDFDFRADSSVADGHWPATGAVQSSLSYRAGSTVRFDGQAVEAGLDGNLTTSSGSVLPVLIDRNGKVTSKK